MLIRSTPCRKTAVQFRPQRSNKKIIMAKKNNAGRPTKMTDTVLTKLEQAFSMGCTDNEACLYADINPLTLYRYQKENEGYCKRKEMLKDKPILLARTELVKGLKNNPELSLKYLERKLKDEFSLRTESKQTIQAEINITIEDEALLEELE